MKRVYAAYALGIVVLYGFVAWTGWEPWPPRRGLIPASARQAPGGYRSYHYWRGGK